MEFYIQLNDPSRQVYPGSVVEGSILLDAYKDVDVGEVNITLRGRCVSWYKKDDDTRNTLECYFFRYTEVLYTGNYTIGKANSPSWPFSFRFPETALPCPWNPGWIVRKDGQSTRGWAFRPGSSLPSSFSFTSSSNRMGCDIIYELDAKLKKPTTSFHLVTQKFRHTLPLVFNSTRAEEIPPPLFLRMNRRWDVQSYRLMPENRERRLTFKEKLNSVFSSDLPVSRFDFSASFPSLIVQGGLFPINLHTTWDSDGSSIDQIPPMHIREVKVTALQLIAVRGATGYDRTRTQKFELSSSKGLKLDINPFVSGVGGKGDGNDDGDKKREAQDPATAPIELGSLLKVTTHNLTPSFLSYGCRVSYTLKVKIGLQCVDQKYEIGCEGVKFTVVSSYYAPGQSDPLAEIQNQASSSEIQPTYSPPPYQASVAEKAPSYEAESSSKAKS